jgi:hypothetical protein
MEYLCYLLEQILRNDDRPVIDKTGLAGYYDFTLTFQPDLPPGFDKANLPPEFLDSSECLRRVAAAAGVETGATERASDLLRDRFGGEAGGELKPLDGAPAFHPIMRDIEQLRGPRLDSD